MPPQRLSKMDSLKNLKIGFLGYCNSRSFPRFRNPIFSVRKQVCVQTLFNFNPVLVFNPFQNPSFIFLGNA